MIDDMVLAGARIYAIPMSTRFRGITLRAGMLIEGLTGWGEFCPFPEYDDQEAAPWLATAVEQVTWAGRSRCGTPAAGDLVARAARSGAARL